MYAEPISEEMVSGDCSLISHRNQKKDLAKAKEMGIEAYLAEQHAKKRILERLLTEYNDGTKDVFFCLAVNMLALDDLTAFLDHAAQEAKTM